MDAKSELKEFVSKNIETIQELDKLKVKVKNEEANQFVGKWFSTNILQDNTSTLIFAIKVKGINENFAPSFMFTIEIQRGCIEYNERKISDFHNLFEVSDFSVIEKALSFIESRIEIIRNVDIDKMKQQLNIS